jgi:taurine dioxygenase
VMQAAARTRQHHARNMRCKQQIGACVEVLRQVANMYQDVGLPEVMILSNKVENGKPVGLSDAGQDWHTDMSYSKMIAFTNVLYGIEIPHRDGEPLGNTEFCNMHAAYDDLPEALKTQLAGMSITHNFEKFWEKMRLEKGQRPPLTDAQRAAKPPVSHPIFMTHPITGKQVLYANPGYSMRINELPQAESDEILAFLFTHQLQEKYQYRHRWSVGDVLMWDNMGTLHNAVPDYRPDEHRYIKRCQVMANRYFESATA